MPRAISPSGPLNTNATPAAGRPCMVSSTWVLRLVMAPFPFSSSDPPDQPQPADAAVGNDVQSHEADRADVGEAIAKDVDLVRLQLRFGEQHRPALRKRAY